MKELVQPFEFSLLSRSFVSRKYLLLCFIWALVWHPVVEARYRCTLTNFIRLGNSCYFLSAEIVSWQEAHFRCRDKGAQLAVLASHYEDSTLRSYLERPEFAQLGRWIGGMWAGKWIWAAMGADIENLESFASEDISNLKDTDQWMCLYMDPNNQYLWNGENCMRQLHYICEAPLTRVIDNSTTTAEASPTAPTPADYDSSVSNLSTAMEEEEEAEEDGSENDAGMDLISSTVEEINLPSTPTHD